VIAGLVVVIASTVVYLRMTIEIAVTAPGNFWKLAPPLAVMMAAMAGIAGYMYWNVRREPLAAPDPGNPAELVPALVFAGLYAAVLLAAAFAREHLGNAGLYVVGFLSGLHDVDAITLSTAGYVEEGTIAPPVGWRVALFASLVNLVVKGIYAFALGGWLMLRTLLLPFGLALICGAALIFAWPL
jgi:uncharacterized membrane protein (DUF4010 family)